MPVQLDNEKVEALRANLRGPMLLPGDNGYDEARTVWNGMIDRRPALVVQPTGNADVIAAVNFAREQGMAVSVKGGGHSVAGKAVADDALLIDLSLMNGVYVDPDARLARAQGGATWGIFDRECQVYGLASTGGVISTTGVGGLTLGGGLGYLMGKHGLSIDNLLSADIVTASGEVLRASEKDNPDLFWALRGGSGNFGVVTSFEFQVHAVGPMITGGIAAWPLAMGRDVAAFYHRLTEAAPEDLTTFLAFGGAPDGSGNLLAIMIPVHTGSLEDGARVVQPIKEFGPPVMDMLGPIPYQAQQSMLDAGFAAGQTVYWKSTFLTGLSQEAIDVIVRKAEAIPVPTCNLVLEHFHGAVRRVPRDATAFQERDAAYNIAIVGVWNDPKDEAACTAWARSTYDDLQPFSTGSVYVNYLGVGDEEERVQAAYGSNYERLAEIKQKHDPGNLFRVNQNIRPRA
jgi:FAD/FMN-containing dehydrogenase